ncbi:hypothetical protein AQUCO_05800164v1 [Aquilegia coerulea]|uniref:KIB1-4 beta-propeller domain-containing protein n=1 Tax=Aquilegia coerulea TaxID=218851 RepID=A0A2G5CF34_AQUCA|nr:hypothetical protein AQUCO_05800164v1 [Aquilegia coerulea]
MKVCHPWRSVTLNHKRHIQFLKSFPWLLLTAGEEEDQRYFFIPSENRACRLNLPEARGCHCWGSPNGWLVTLGFDQQFHLLNPLTRKRLPLPPLSTFKDRNFTASKPGTNRMFCVRKASVFTDDENPQFLVVYLIIGEFQKCAFARPGDTTWTVVGKSDLLIDVINFNGKLYAVKNGGHIRVCDDPNGPHPTLIHFAALPDVVMGTERFYLVELGGELHLVVRTSDRTQTDIPPYEFHHYVKTSYFEVFKLDLSTLKWDELETLGDYALFVGSNTTFALKASHYPDQCKAGCIYFTDDYDEAYGKLVGDDMGIYNLEADTFELLYKGDDILSRFSPPVWITPKPF